MENQILKCISCNTKITNLVGSAIFKCPQCLKETIIRCDHCRKIGAKYTCKSCNFEGPN